MSKDPLQHTVTALLHRWKAGDRAAHDALMPLVYGHLRRLAQRSFSGERSDHTLQHTALVHEAYLELVRMEVGWNDRAHFFALAARAMRRILVDHARTRNREKRGSGIRTVPIASLITPSISHSAINGSAIASIASVSLSTKMFCSQQNTSRRIWRVISRSASVKAILTQITLCAVAIVMSFFFVTR